MEKPYMLPILFWQYHACWCPGNFRSQGISRHGIDHISRNIPSPAQEELSQHIMSKYKKDKTEQRVQLIFDYKINLVYIK